MSSETTMGWSAAPERERHAFFQRVFTGLLVLYWALQFARGDSIELIPSEAAYYLFVGPAAAFAVFGLGYILMKYPRIEAIPLMIGAFGVIVTLVSLARGDLRTVSTMGLFSVTLIILFQVRPKISLGLINTLFILSALITTGMYFFEYSLYTFVPGIGAHPDLPWRISPFPSVAEGALFAMVVFIANLTIRSQRHRYPMLAFSAYMLVFSGIRTAIIAAAISAIYVALNRYEILRTRSARAIFLIGTIGLFVFSIFSSQLLLALPFADSEIMQTLFFREEALGHFDADGQIGTAAVRNWIMTQHLSMFSGNPLVGVGTFDFMMTTSGYGALDNSGGTGSEAFVTGLLARVGLLSIPLFVALFLMHLSLRDDAAELSICGKICLIVGMISYGSFVNAYDIVFILLTLAIAGCIEPVVGRRSRRAAGVPVMAG